MRRPYFKILCILLALVLPVAGMSYAEEKEKPPINPLRITGELVAGSAGGLLVAVPVVRGILNQCDKIDKEDFAEDLILTLFCVGAAVSAGGLVFPVGVGAGVTSVGNLGNQRGSFSNALAFSYAGEIAGIGLALIIRNPRSWIAIPIGAVVGGVYGFNRHRAYDETGELNSALINFKSDGVSLGLPMIYPRVSPGNHSFGIMTHLVRFEL